MKQNVKIRCIQINSAMNRAELIFFMDTFLRHPVEFRLHERAFLNTEETYELMLNLRLKTD